MIGQWTHATKTIAIYKSYIVNWTMNFTMAIRRSIWKAILERHFDRDKEGKNATDNSMRQHCNWTLPFMLDLILIRLMFVSLSVFHAPLISFSLSLLLDRRLRLFLSGCLCRSLSILSFSVVHITLFVYLSCIYPCILCMFLSFWAWWISVGIGSFDSFYSRHRSSFLNSCVAATVFFLSRLTSL